MIRRRVVVAAVFLGAMLKSCPEMPGSSFTAQALCGEPLPPSPPTSSYSYIFTFAPGAAWADEPTATLSRTVLLIATDGDRTGARVRAELAALGFYVVDVSDVPGPRAESEVELSARSAHAVAAIAMGRAGSGVRVWTLAPGQDGLVLRATIEDYGDVAVVALRAVEALRTSIGDIPAPAGPVASRAVAPPAGDDQRRIVMGANLPPRLGVSIAPAFSLTPGQPSASWQVVAILHWLWAAHWGVEAIGDVPLSGARWSESEGSGSVTYALAAAGFRWEALATRHHIGDVGVGMGSGFIHVEGSPAAGFVGNTTNTAVAAPYARIGYGFVALPWLRIRADIAGVLAVPRPVLTFAGRDGGSWGQPLLSGSIGVEVVSR